MVSRELGGNADGSCARIKLRPEAAPSEDGEGGCGEGDEGEVSDAEMPIDEGREGNRDRESARVVREE